jgi:hypothetical protein
MTKPAVKALALDAICLIVFLLLGLYFGAVLNAQTPAPTPAPAPTAPPAQPRLVPGPAITDPSDRAAMLAAHIQLTEAQRILQNIEDALRSKYQVQRACQLISSRAMWACPEPAQPAAQETEAKQEEPR